jgi:hypothetical protein
LPRSLTKRLHAGCSIEGARVGSLARPTEPGDVALGPSVRVEERRTRFRARHRHRRRELDRGEDVLVVDREVVDVEEVVRAEQVPHTGGQRPAHHLERRLERPHGARLDEQQEVDVVVRVGGVLRQPARDEHAVDPGELREDAGRALGRGPTELRIRRALAPSAHGTRAPGDEQVGPFRRDAVSRHEVPAHRLDPLGLARGDEPLDLGDGQRMVEHVEVEDEPLDLFGEHLHSRRAVVRRSPCGCPLPVVRRFPQ